MNKFIIILLFVVSSVAGYAQWSDDPGINTFVAGSDHSRTYPQIAVDLSGSSYFSNWENVPDTSINYNFWLQRLDGQGNRAWGDDGIRVSANPCRSSLTGYDLTIDSAGHIIVAFEDMRAGNGFSHVYLYSFSTSGTSVGDTGGIQADTGSFNSGDVVLAVTAKGNILVGWNCFYRTDTIERTGIRIMKYSPAGQPLWPGPIAMHEPDSTNRNPVILPVSEDDFILIWLRKFEEGSLPGAPWFTYILAQRFDSSGQPVWPQALKVCDHGDSAYVMPVYLKVATARDENEGFFIGWDDDRFHTHHGTIYVQHLDLDGNVRWIQNGIPVAVDTMNYDRAEPGLIFDPAGQSLYVLWMEARPQGILMSFGLCGQKMSATGDLKWGYLGKIFKGFDLDTAFYLVNVHYTPHNDLMFFYCQEYDSIVGQDTLLFVQLFASRIDTSGAFLWSPAQTLMAATNGMKFYPEMASYSNGMYIATWAENRNSPFDQNGDVYAQNIDVNGNLGPQSITNLNGSSGNVMIVPNPSVSSAWLVFKNTLNGYVKIRIFNSIGQEFFVGWKAPFPGTNRIFLDANSMAPGIYFIELSHNGKVQTLKWAVVSL